MLFALSAVAALLLLLLMLKLSHRLTLRLRVLAGVTVSRQPQKSCPHLGHASDPFAHGSNPSDEHRCYLYMQRDRIDLMHQKSFCLSTAHYKCPWLMIRRPDAPPPLSQRLAGVLAGGPRQAWALAFAALKGLPAATASDLGRLGRVPGQGARLADAGVGHLARATRHVGGDLGHALGISLVRVGKAFAAVLADVWALTQHSSAGVALLARAVRFVLRAVWWLVRAPARGLVLAFRALSRSAREASARRRAAREARAAETAVAAVAMQAGPAIDKTRAPELGEIAEPFPELVQSEPLRVAPAEEVQLSEPPPVAEPVRASAAVAEPAEAITQRLEAPLARFEELLTRLETLVSDGVKALDHGQDELAYQLFLKATEQPTKLAEKAAPELRSQHTSLMTRAWFWRAKTAETVEEVVQTLEQALRYEPENLQIQAHLAWARQRLEREKHVEEGAAEALQPVTLLPLPSSTRKRLSLLAAMGIGVRMVGGLMALALAALWMTTAVMPAVGQFLTQLPAEDEQIVRRLLLTLNTAALPGEGHLPLPLINYDLGLALPFVLAFLFVFTARGLMDGDSWARTTGLLLAAVGGWLCVAAVTNPDAGRLGLALCLGIIVAAVAGRFDSPKVLSRISPGY
jgi:hypothetical protein